MKTMWSFSLIILTIVIITLTPNALANNTGSVKLDKAVYPTPFGTIGTSPSGDFDKPVSSVTSLNGVFPMHGDTTQNGLTASNTLSNGDVIVHIRVNDQDYNISSTGTDKIALGILDANHGPVSIQITRQGSSLLLATAGGPAVKSGTILNLNGTSLKPQNDASWASARDLGPMTEIGPDAGIFQADLPIRFTDGPQGSDCPSPNRWVATDGTSGRTETNRFHSTHTALNNNLGNYCVRQGDVLTVTYTDLNNTSGHTQTVTDSSTFDLRTGVLQSDKSVYVIGSEMILTLVEPDLNLDSQTAETASLDLIEWDSHAMKNTMGPLNTDSFAAFDAKPSMFVETGKDTGIFQSVIKIPKKLNNNLLERGEQIHLEYTDWGPAGAKVVGANNQNIQLTIYTSNFGATVELDQKAYTWTDRVYIKIVAKDFNFDPNVIDTIGDLDYNVIVSTKNHKLSPYKLAETGVDTGIFTGYVILTGDPSTKGIDGIDGNGLNPTGAFGGTGPVDGFIPAENSDGISVSFEFTRDQTVTSSAEIRWNVGKVSWLNANYLPNDQGIVQVIDPDMNLNPKAIDKFYINVLSDSDPNGIKITMTETGEDTGIFRGIVQFIDSQSFGNNLQVKDGNIVTAIYDDRTLPSPCTPQDNFKITDTTFIGTVAPPKTSQTVTPCVAIQEKSLVMNNLRFVDTLGHPLQELSIDQQVMISADVTNNQQFDQPFVYVVKVEDGSGKITYNRWISSKLNSGQTENVAQSWIPTQPGKYLVKISVLESIYGVSLTQPAQLEADIAGPINPDFTINAEPNVLQIYAGKASTSNISITLVKGNVQSISLSCDTNIPTNKGSCKIIPSTIKSGETAVMTVYTDKTIQPTDYKITITGTTHSITHASLVSLNVQPIVKSNISISPNGDSFDINSEIPFSASFDDRFTDAINKFQWNFDDGQSESGQSLTHAFQSPGSHTVTLTVFYVNGDKSEITKYLTIKEKSFLTTGQAAAIGGVSAAAAGGSWAYFKYIRKPDNVHHVTKDVTHTHDTQPQTKIPKPSFTLKINVRLDWK